MMESLLNTEVDFKTQLDIEATLRPDLLPLLSSMRERYIGKLYHELVGLFLTYISAGPFQQYEKVVFFRHVIGPIITKLQPLRIAVLMQHTVENLSAEDALLFLGKYAPTVEKNKEANLFLLSLQACQFIRQGKFKEADEILEGVKNDIDVTLGLNCLVIAAYYQTNAALCKALSKPSEFYKNAMMYLSYTHLNSIPLSERNTLAFEISVAAIVSDVYNFGEMLRVPLVQSYAGTGPEGWILDFLNAFNEGSIEMFDAAMTHHASQLDHSVLSSHKEAMKRKIIILALIELAFHRPKKQRNIHFSDIAAYCKIPLDEVECVAMKAMSLKLVRGSIDQLNQKLCLTWVRPRILDNSRILKMQQSIDSLCNSSKELLSKLEDITPELLVS